MNEPIKFLFDENFGEPLVSALARVLNWYEEDTIEIRHVFRFTRPGEKDEVWIPKIAPGGWVVISSDRGKRCGGKKLPDVCRENKVIHIILSSTLCGAKSFEKMRAILSVWPRIVMAARWKKGSRFLLRYEGADRRVILVESSVAESAAPVGAQRLGFDGRKQRSPHVPRKRVEKVIPYNQALWDAATLDKFSSKQKDQKIQ